MGGSEATGMVLGGGTTPSRRTGSFPKELRRGLFSRLDRRFSFIFGSLLLVFFTAVWILSHVIKIKNEVSEKEILQIQERYAQLVLNQPKPKVEPKVKETQPVVEEKTSQVTEEAAKTEEVKVNREKETFVEKEKRRESGAEERQQKREQIASLIQTTGIFAAITSSGSGGGMASSRASDLLGSGSDEVMGDLNSMNVSKGAFAAAKKPDEQVLTAKKGTRTGGVSIQTEEVKKAAVTQVASAGSVNITSQPPEITGESASSADRSQSAIQQVVNRETTRLKRVFEEWLKRDPSLSGRLTVKFTILPAGSVTNVAVVKSTTNNSEFDETILRYIKRWQFPEVSGGSPVEVVYPFVFEGQS